MAPAGWSYPAAGTSRGEKQKRRMGNDDDFLVVSRALPLRASLPPKLSDCQHMAFVYVRKGLSAKPLSPNWDFV